MIRIGGEKLYVKVSDGKLILVYGGYPTPEEYALADEELKLISIMQKPTVNTVNSKEILNRDISGPVYVPALENNKKVNEE